MQPISKLNEMVLIVDDDPQLLTVLTTSLQEAGYTTLTAGSVNEALDRVANNTVFIVVSDYRMGKENGLDLLEKLRNSHPDLPFVFMTGFSDKDLAVEAMRLGACDLLDKPVTDIDLIPLLEKYGSERIRVIEELAEEQEMLRGTFIEEAGELLDGIENLLINLEERPDDKTIINDLYRRTHTIKGSCGTITGCEGLKELSHAFENILTFLKEDQLTCSQDLVSLMIRVTDTQVQCLKWLESGSQEAAPVVDDLIGELNQFGKGATGETPAKKEGTPAPAAPKKSMEVHSSKTDEGVMVSNDKLDHFMELAGGLVAFKNNFQGSLQHNLDMPQGIRSQYEDMNRTLSKISDQIQMKIMEIRKVPLSTAFARFPRTVRQVALEYQKKIRLRTEGAELEVDKTIARTLSNALIHIIRNACDHGIEDPETRAKAGKKSEGTITLKARLVEDQIVVIVEDDGNGINREKIAAKAVKSGIMSEAKAEAMSDEEVFDLIFHPGFSTAEKVTDISGRGVGMDVVKTAIANVNGKILVTSEQGKYTRMQFTIPAPRTVMIEQSVIASSEGFLIAIPLNCIAKITSIEKESLNFVESGWTYQFNGHSIPIASYGTFVGTDQVDRKATLKDKELVAVISHKDQEIGLRVEQVYDQIEAVVRPFDKVIEKVDGFKGTSQLANDDLAYVLSPEEMVALVLEQQAA